MCFLNLFFHGSHSILQSTERPRCQRFRSHVRPHRKVKKLGATWVKREPLTFLHILPVLATWTSKRFAFLTLRHTLARKNGSKCKIRVVAKTCSPIKFWIYTGTCALAQSRIRVLPTLFPLRHKR